MTEINNKKRKIDDNQEKKDNTNYHPFVRSNKKREALPVSPNNYLINVKQLKKYMEEEEIKKENDSSSSIEASQQTIDDKNEESGESVINEINKIKKIKEENEINNKNPFISVRNFINKFINK